MSTQATTNSFFLYLPYTAPHAPLQAWPEDIAKFEGHFSEGWDVLATASYRWLIEAGHYQRDLCSVSR